MIFLFQKGRVGIDWAVLTREYTYTHQYNTYNDARWGNVFVCVCVSAVLVSKHKIERHERLEKQRCHHQAIDSLPNSANI